MKQALRHEMRMDWHDRYGACMGWWFAIADLLTVEQVPIPAEWDFRQALGGPETDSPGFIALSELWQAGHVDADDLVRAGNVLQRYARLCVLAGVSY